MSDLVENDTSFALLSHHVPEIFNFMFSSDGGGGHFEPERVSEAERKVLPLRIKPDFSDLSSPLRSRSAAPRSRSAQFF